MPILGSSNSTAKKDMMSKIWTIWDTIIWVENIVGKGEIARYEQFLLFPQCFQKLIRQNEYVWSKGLTCIKTGTTE